jgi:hypothetical protein
MEKHTARPQAGPSHAQSQAIDPVQKELENVPPPPPTGAAGVSPTPETLQYILPQVKELAQRVGGLDQLAKIIEELRELQS